MENVDIEKRMAILKERILKTKASVAQNADLSNKLNVKSGEILRMLNDRKG